MKSSPQVFVHAALKGIGVAGEVVVVVVVLMCYCGGDVLC